MTFCACSRGVLPLVSSQACTLATVSSCFVAGGTIETVNRVAAPMLANANPLRLNSAIPSAAASYNEEADTVTV